MRAVAVMGAVMILLVSSARWSTSLARYMDNAATAALFTADTLTPPTGLGVSGGFGLTATLTWTPTLETYATGYRVYRSTTSGSGFVLVATVTPRTATTTTNSPALPGTYYYILRSYAANWLSAPSNQVSVFLL
jgi:hypothetical protein